MASNPTASRNYCTCTVYCKGGKHVGQTTWYKHAKYRRKYIIPPFVPPESRHGTESSNEERASKRQRSGESDHDRDEVDQEEEEEEEVDQVGSGGQRGDDHEDGAESSGRAGVQEYGNEWDMDDDFNHENDRDDSPVRTGSPLDLPHENDSESSEDEDSDIQQQPDRGSVADIDRADRRGRIPHEPSDDEESDNEDPTLGVHSRGQADDNPQSPEPLIDRTFVPHIEELKVSQQFISALQEASLDNGDLPEEVLARLRDPPQNVLEIDNADDLYSLKQFLGTQHASQKTYTNVCNTHNERYPNDPMLSYDQVKRKVAEWSGVQPIVHDMCPNSCVAYTGPFELLEQCPPGLPVRIIHNI